MLKSALLSLSLLAVLSSTSYSSTPIAPTTTLAAETGNNTGAANSFTTSSNGNAGAGNVSKESLRKLLYPGSTARIYAHYMGWFGGANHMNVGYESASATQVRRQIDDMMSRGIDGVIIDWYGPADTRINQATLYVKQEAETRAGKFTFAIMEDQGAVRTCAYTAGCDVTQMLINHFNYINSTYASSPAYMRVDGQPVIFSFDVENLPNIDWSRVLANVEGNPKIVLRNNPGFTKFYTSGSSAWVQVNQLDQGDWGQAYLRDFYLTSRSYPNMLVIPATWKGFDDTGASWGNNRIMSQNCGQAWLSTFAEMNRYFSASQQVHGIQLVTWNDYEEGTAIESGIDNCVSISGSANGTDLYWSITGQENTVDHYEVFISQDGQNLMKLQDVPPGTRQLSLAPFDLDAGNYTLYVKAVGKPSMVNKISGAIPVTITSAAPVAVLNVTPSSGTAPLTVTATTAESRDPDGSITSTRIDFGDGFSSNSTEGNRTYSVPGTYAVTATVTDNSGKSSTATATITVKANVAPLALISVTPSTGTTPVTVTASSVNSTDTDGSIVSSTIDFGDGCVSTGPTASHVYYSAGTYTVKATVTDNGGLTASSYALVDLALPATPFTVNALSPLNNSVVTGPVRIVASTTSSSAVTAMKIYVDHQAVYLANASSVDTVLRLAPGTHFVVVQAWNQAGQIAKVPLNITVASMPPVARLSVTPKVGTAPLTVMASTAGSADPDGKITSSRISFGDGTVVAGSSASRTFTTPGTYTIAATVTDDSGLSAKAQTTVTVNPGSVVRIAAPADGVTTGRIVRVVAKAASATPIAAMQIYVDHTPRYVVDAAYVDASLTLVPGTRYIVVQAWDTTGKVYKSDVSITVK